MTFYHSTPGNRVLCGQAGNAVNAVILTKGTLDKDVVSVFSKQLLALWSSQVRTPPCHGGERRFESG